MVTMVKVMEQHKQKHKQRQTGSPTHSGGAVELLSNMDFPGTGVRNNMNATSLTTNRLLKLHEASVACDTGDQSPPSPAPSQTSIDPGMGKKSSAQTGSSATSDLGTSNAPKSSSLPSMSQPLRVGLYEVGRTIGKGNFAVVKLARHRITMTEVAIKIIDKSKLDEANLEKVYREVEVMKLLDHSNIVKLYQVMTTRNMIYIVSEYAAGGEIFDYIATHGRMSEALARQKFWQIIKAVDYCHQRRVVHRDLKAENLLLDSDMNIKIADFGFSNYFKPDGCLMTWCGSPPYAAPEVFEGKQYTGPEIDVWSLGVVLYVLVCGALPFDASSLHALRDRVLSGRFRIPFFMTSDCESLIRKMLVRDPEKRYTIPMIKRHRWMQVKVPADEVPASAVNPDVEAKSGRKCDVAINEDLIKIMGVLGIDTNATREAVKNEVYDHLAAIYFLLQDKYNKDNKRLARDQGNTSRSPMPSGAPTRPCQLQSKDPRAAPARHFSLGADEVEHQGRRPSSVAEQALSETSRFQVTQVSGGPNRGRLQLAPGQHPQTLWQSSNPEALGGPSPSGMVATDYECIICKGPILENTTSTTTCVKCARLRTRRRNFAHPNSWSNQSATSPREQQPAQMGYQYSFCSEERPRGPHDSRDSGVSSGSSQDYGECTPPVEKSLGFPRFPTRMGSSDRPTVPFSQFVRKLSEVEGIVPPNLVMKSSLDEGVDINNGSESALSEVGSIHSRRLRLSQMTSFESTSLGSCSSSVQAGNPDHGINIKDSPGGSFTSTDSYPYESFDDSLVVDESELTQSLPSCAASLVPVISAPVLGLQGATSDLVPSMIHSEGHPPYGVSDLGMASNSSIEPSAGCSSNFLQIPSQQPTYSHQGADRQFMRSPVHFREGRRASDGFMAQNIIAFQQRLYDKNKTHGQMELNDVHEEHRALQNQFGLTSVGSSTPPDHLVSAGVRQRKATLGSGGAAFTGRPSISKRISVPENFTYFPNACPSQPSSLGTLGTSSDLQYLTAKQVALQHQLMQHRLQQKRHTSKPSRLFPSDSGGVNRHRTALSARQASKYSQQAGGINKPYLPSQEAFQVGVGVPGGDFLFQPIEEDESGLDEIHPPDARGPSPTGSESQWQTLPSYMQQTCHLGGSGPGPSNSPPPPAPRDPTETMDTLAPLT